MNASFIFRCILLGIASLGAQNLRTAWENMMQQHPQQVAGEAKRQSHHAQLAALESQKLPKLDVFANYQYQTQAPKTEIHLPALAPGMAPLSQEITLGDHDRSEIGATISYPVFTGFAQSHHIEASRLSVEAYSKQLEYTQHQLAYQFGALYWMIQWHSIQAQWRKAQIQAHAHYVQMVEAQMKAGTATLAQWYNAHAKMAKSLADTSSTRQTLDSLYAEFELLTGITYPIHDTTRYTLSPINKSTKPLLAQGLEIQAQSLSHAQKAALSQRYPSLYTFASYRLGNPGINQGTNEWMHYGVLGIQAQWNIFDGFQRQALSKQYQSESKILLTQANQIKKDQITRHQIIQNQQKNLKAELQAIQAGVEAAQQAHQAYQAAFSNGSALANDVLDAELLLAEWQAKRAQWEVRRQLLDLQLFRISESTLQLTEEL